MSELIWPDDAVTHMWDNHHTTVAIAVDALNDPDVVAFIPDPKSQSGKSNRFIGFSPSVNRILIVIVVDYLGQLYGANCWPANPADQRIYRERNTP